MPVESAARNPEFQSDDGGRPAVTRDNVIRGNVVEGLGSGSRCVAGKRGVDLGRDTVVDNTCK